MTPTIRLTAALLTGLVCAAHAQAPAQAQAQTQAQDTIRPEVGTPLQAAHDLIKAGKYKDALGKLRDAEAVANRTAHEEFMVARFRGVAALGAGDDATAIRSFEAVLAGGRLPAAEQLPVFEELAGAAMRSKNYAKAIEWSGRYLDQGGTNPKTRSLRTSAQYLSGDYAAVVRTLKPQLDPDPSGAPKAPLDESTLRMLAASHHKLEDAPGSLRALQALLVSYPKKAYWADALAELQTLPGFDDKLMLDVYRLQLLAGAMDPPDQYLEMAQLAMQAGLPAEAKRVLQAGTAAGALGTGAQADRDRRLLDAADKQAAADEKSLQAPPPSRSADEQANLGMAMVTSGRVDKGIALIEQAIAKGGLKRLQAAKLHLGQAQLQLGNAPQAIETFKTVQGNDGTADLARLWAIRAGRP
jgi:hypothetical protein